MTALLLDKYSQSQVKEEYDGSIIKTTPEKKPVKLGKERPPLNCKRGEKYHEIVFSSLPPSLKTKIQNLVNGAATAEKIDEHGSWRFTASFDRKGRGSALNWDVYGYGYDYHNRRFLAVVQIRQYIKEKRDWYPQIRKSYFLLGRNEDDTIFAHPVQSQVIHCAIRKKRNVLLAVQRWIFDYDYRQIIRHGDLALIPASKHPRLRNVELSPLFKQFQGSHNVFCEGYVVLNDNIYVFSPYLQHVPQTHPDVKANGWFKLVVGQRSNFYNFAAPTVD